MYPCKHTIVTEIATEWYESQNNKQTRTHVNIEVNTLSKITKAVSSKNTSFATDIVNNILKNNVWLRAELEIKESEPANNSKYIVKYAKHFIKLRLAKSNTT